MIGNAFTRAVSPNLSDCALTHLDRSPIDLGKAEEQHAAYEHALRDAGLDVIRFPPLPDHPDGVFVEDTAVIIDGHAVITRPRLESRASEAESAAAALADKFVIHRLASGFVEGGDVLRVGDVLYVGLSSRSDMDGAAALGQVVKDLGLAVATVELRGRLHLKTAATVAGLIEGRPVLLYSRGAVDPGLFGDIEPLAVAEDEPYAANVLRVGERLIMSAAYPQTALLLQDRGFDVVMLDVSELEKAEAGVTCMSLVS